MAILERTLKFALIFACLSHVTMSSIMHNFVKNAEGICFKTIFYLLIKVKRVKYLFSEDSEEEYYDDYAEEEGNKVHIF